MSSLNELISVSYTPISGHKYNASKTESSEETRLNHLLNSYYEDRLNKLKISLENAMQPLPEELPQFTEEKTQPSSNFIGWNFQHKIKKPISTNISGNANWLNTLTQVYKTYGLSDNAIRNLLTKNALESNWGKHSIGNFNYGNLIATDSWKGDKVKGGDKDANGKRIFLYFRSYSSLEDYIKDELSLLQSKYDFNPNDTLEQFASKLMGNNSSGYKYAQDPNYMQKLKNIKI